jgi:GNAT superfamily N-acetyltransferase
METTSINYSLLERTPTPQQYHDLHKKAGLTPPPLSPALPVIPKALAGSWYSVIVIDRTSAQNQETPEQIIGMGRLVGDGALFLQVVDMAVDPEFQGKGIGRAILERLMKNVDERAPDAYVSLIGDVPANERFYPKFGFRDVSPSTGMARYREKRVRDVGYGDYQK